MTSSSSSSTKLILHHFLPVLVLRALSPSSPYRRTLPLPSFSCLLPRSVCARKVLPPPGRCEPPFCGRRSRPPSKRTLRSPASTTSSRASPLTAVRRLSQRKSEARSEGSARGELVRFASERRVCGTRSERWRELVAMTARSVESLDFEHGCNERV
ncbi:hypothetical protein AAT19DRAFT_12196 [Rhodotorula toruloides]|uniref:Uncharacterized protein n=1 Tax=Rhodotorula toruloides TaxID=5286 RepID=A0A2T0AFK4_RHOTO|nr:hypothetical protein AAT19DRAFT_12196 [Rhodotorula toruloides]